MKRIAAGILAHVDAGKTTLSEGLLYCAGEIRSLGRVDLKTAFLDTDEIERRRGITVFSKQAILTVDNAVITLLDTPGHVDFSAEAERTLQVLDYAILVISATDGIQGHTKTLWELLKKRKIPVFVFINKLDLEGADKTAIIDELNREFGSVFVDFCDSDSEKMAENIAVCNESIMHRYLDDGIIDEQLVAKAIKICDIVPVFSGSALKAQGIDRFLKAFARLTVQGNAPAEFGAKVFKIGRDDKGSRLTYLKVTGGSLKVKDVVSDGEKINEIRIYSGEKYQNASVAECGCVCAVTGPAKTFVGQGLGFEKNSGSLTSEPIFSYRVILPQGVDAGTALEKLRKLQEEETQLNIKWNEQLKEIQLRIMGEIQLEVLKQVISKRFDMDVEFEEGRIVYKETIENRVEGVGHYEPLRHYAEVHLLLEPLPQGSGMQFVCDCSEDELDKARQRLVMTHLMEKPHLGVLTGSPITDIRITLKSGKAHIKHTDGGDFRQATYRAVRHGLRCAKSVLLEPYYDFSIEIPDENVGKAMNDLNLMGAEIELPNSWGGKTRIVGYVAAEAIRNYQGELVGYTHGKGKLSCRFRGYGPCRNAEAVVAEIGYDPDSDIENTADSVFCSHGAGVTVKWNEVTKHMHIESILKTRRTEAERGTSQTHCVAGSASDEELMKIFEHTYGKIERKNPNHILKTPKSAAQTSEYKPKKKKEFDKEYLLIDGYNIIFAWDCFKELAADSMDAARNALIDRVSAYGIFKDCEIILVFDAYKVKGNPGEVSRVNGITVVYTKEAQTADSYIEKTATRLSKNYRVTVATSDALEQMIIFGSGAYRLSARAFSESVIQVENRVREVIEEYNTDVKNAEFLRAVRDKVEKLDL